MSKKKNHIYLKFHYTEGTTVSMLELTACLGGGGRRLITVSGSQKGFEKTCAHPSLQPPSPTAP